jgi:hypothetical protein
MVLNESLILTNLCGTKANTFPRLLGVKCKYQSVKLIKTRKVRVRICNAILRSQTNISAAGKTIKAH